MNSKHFEKQISDLEALSQQMQNAQNIEKKLHVLNCQNTVQEYLKRHLVPNFNSFSKQEEVVYKSILAIDQGNNVFKGINASTYDHEVFKTFLLHLVEVDEFYSTIGGLIGYHLNMLKLISHHIPTSAKSEKLQYQHPVGIEISQDTHEVRQSVRWGIESLEIIAVMYPVGGAGDRLNLQDEKTGEALPAALLPFCGRSLLEGLIRDLQAREYLFYKMHGKQLETPIAMMTSHEKNNHHYILNICEDNNWFGRNKDNFHFFIQPLVPMIDEYGDWVMQGPLQMLLKPGGHGVIWKLASDRGIIDRLLAQNYTKVLVRQINNPIAGIDNGLSAFLGWGFHYDKDFGFASCPRLLNTSEGMDVLVEKEIPDGFEYFISNIEYTEFEKHGVEDVSAKPGSQFSLFPANTNILFADLETIKETVSYCPLPGMLVNMKTSVTVSDEHGVQKNVLAGRLESTMQNVSDYIVDHYPDAQKNINPKELKSFITYNERRKTISVAKKAYVPGGSLLETPENCFFELLQNHEDLLKNYCHFSTPTLEQKEYFEHGPSFIFLFHPALGPLYQIIGQKLRKGVIAKESELQLEITEASIEGLDLQGSLLVEAQHVLGGKNNANKIDFHSNLNGKCLLKNVVVKNKGIDKTAPNVYWKNQIKRKESLRITLEGGAEFIAEDVVFEGDFNLKVPSGHCMRAFMQNGQVVTRLEKISKPTWYWSYSFDTEDRIQLTKVMPQN